MATSSRPHGPRRSRPWAAIALGSLTLLLAAIGVGVNIPTSWVTVEVTGTTVSAEQVRAAIGGELQAYEPTRLLVCDADTARQCASPAAGTVAVVVNGRFAGARVQKGWLPVLHDESEYEPDGDDMVRDAFDNAHRAGQQAGAAALAARAAVDAQAQAVKRTPLGWLAIVLAGGIATAVAARRHAKRSRERRELWHDLAVGSRSLATVTLDLEMTGLSALQLRDGSRSAAARQLQEAAREVERRSLELSREEAVLYERVPAGMPTMQDLTAEEADRFRKEAHRLDLLDDAVSQGTALLLRTATAQHAWDANTRSFMEAADRVRAMASEADVRVTGSLAAAVEKLEEVRLSLITVGAQIADQAADPDEVPAALLNAARKTSDGLGDALRSGLAKSVGLSPKAAVKRARELSADEPGTPLLLALAGSPDANSAEKDARLNLAGVELWWREARGQFAAKRKPTPPAPRRKPARKQSELAGNLRAGGGVLGVIVGIGAVVVVLSWGVQAAISGVGALGQDKAVSYISLPDGADWPGLDEANERSGEIRAFVPWRLAVIALPAAPGQDVVKKARPSKYSSGRYFEDLKLDDRSELVRSALANVPELVDPATGDLHPDVMVNVVRDVGQGEYREIGLAWGPTPAPRLSGEYLDHGGWNSADDARGTISTPLFLLRQDLAESLGKPAWTESQSTRVGLGVGVVLAFAGLAAVPLTIAGRRRNRTASRKENDRRLHSVRAKLDALFVSEDTADLNAVTAEERAASPELEDRRVRVKAQILALRRCEELETRPRRRRGQEAHAFDVARLSGLVDALAAREAGLADRVRDYLARG
ncbi:hypothetical protein BIU82_07900 [Arthrobacter sp. SW1]|uniref:DUF5129 domain-containing protein n=1 Tax=Arthrobacter sp. SW1 TaxID=1920889 RepID=UPI000877E7D2|nr:DUF5129 domain-containing protein [Arthrobacter sp. SW1]OFI37778.1 hypothetical protein BIU82_07900 [Arthrobacter sp. SW1]